MAMSDVAIDSVSSECLDKLSTVTKTVDISKIFDELLLKESNDSQESFVYPTSSNVQTDIESSTLPNENDLLHYSDEGQDSSTLIAEDDAVKITDTHDEVSRALLQRKQPLMELLTSEEGYVRRLRLVKDFYIPSVSASVTPVSLQDSSGVGLQTCNLNSLETQSVPPIVPEDLAARWRIVWGNWIQLYEWHSTFLEKLSSVLESDPDRIPKLFIDSRARLRSIYSKYCENHRKAALIAEQYRDYFEELRIYIGDKEDVVSHLMQPVQRIMRYQLPIAEIFKLTQRAGISEFLLWKKTYELVKEIPKDTQLILEAARIDGFPGVITALGNILLRGDLLVATITREQFLENIAAYKLALQESSSFDSHLSYTKTPNLLQASRAISLSDENSTHSSTQPTGTNLSFNDGSNLTPVTNNDPSGLFSGTFKFIESRLFLFEQMLLVTEEVKPKRRMTSSNPFSQSTYQFKAAINVNKMLYERHWYNLSFPSGPKNADAAVIDQLLSIGFAQDDSRFAILDQTPGKRHVYIIDPVKLSTREAWVVQLREIQQMQQNILLALQDPRRFNSGTREDVWTKEQVNFVPNSSKNPDSNVQVVASSTNPPQQQQSTTRKWPSFTMKRPGRLCSSSSTMGSNQNKDINATNKDSLRRSKAMVRSLSDERLSSDANAEVQANERIRSRLYRNSSQNAKTNNEPSKSRHNEMITQADEGINNQPYKMGGLLKKRNMFANLFNRNKSKQRAKPQPRLSICTEDIKNQTSCTNDDNTTTNNNNNNSGSSSVSDTFDHSQSNSDQIKSGESNNESS